MQIPIKKKNNELYTKIIIIVFIIGIGIFGILLLTHNTQAKADEDWKDDFINEDKIESMNNVWIYNNKVEIINPKMKKITISNSGSALTDYQVKIEVAYDSDMQNDFDDIRVTASDENTSLFYWLEEYTDSSNATFWVKVPNIPNGDSLIYIYYGNPFMSTASNFDNTFTKDFEEEGLVGLWHMDEGGGTITLDSSGNGNDGELKGGTAWVGSDGGQWNSRGDVKFFSGDSLSFDGNNDWIDLGDVLDSTFINDIFTISAWVKPENINDGNTHQIIAKSDGTSLNTDDMFSFSFYEHTLRFGVKDNSDNRADVDYYSTDFEGNWCFVTGVYNRPRTNLSLYINGILVNYSYADIDIVNEPNVRLVIGTSYGKEYPATRRFFNGIIDEVRCYKRALSTEEIKTHYERRKYSSVNPSINIGIEENAKNCLLISKEINPPNNYFFSKLIIDKIEPSNTKIKVTILDGKTNEPITGFENLESKEIDIFSINPKEHASLKLKAEFFCTDDETPSLRSWSISWNTNRLPIAIITKPKNNQEFDVNKKIEFNASSSHDEDGDELTFKWESNIEGVLYEGKNASFKTKLTKGKHTITLTVFDVHGAKNETQIVIIVNEETTSEKIKSSIISSLFIGIIGFIIVLIGIIVFVYKQRSRDSSEFLQPTTQQTMSNIGYNYQTSPQYQQNIHWGQQSRVEPQKEFISNLPPKEITIKCPVCNNMINVVSTGQPLEIKCPYCGAEGTVNI